MFVRTYIYIYKVLHQNKANESERAICSQGLRFFGYDAVGVVAVRGQPMLWIVDDLWLLFFVCY